METPKKFHIIYSRLPNLGKALLVYPNEEKKEKQDDACDY